MTEDLIRQRQMIEYDREELGRTVQALAERVDVKARGREAIAAAKSRVRIVAVRYRTVAAIGVVAGVVVTAAVLAVIKAVRRSAQA